MLNSIFQSLKQLVVAPTNIGAGSSEASAGSQRMRALMWGMPAVLIALSGSVALYYARVGLTSDLEQRYLKLVQDAAKEKTKIAQELSTEIRVLQPTADSNTNLDSLIPPDDPRRVRFNQLQESELVFWDKLIALKPDEMEHRFQLALASFNKGDVLRASELMRAIAPDAEPGYPEAHLWLAKYFINLRVTSPQDRARMLDLAYRNADFCLRRDPENLAAKSIKASILFSQRKFAEAYVIFEELFDSNPAIYSQLIQMNGFLNRPEKNAEIYQKALKKFEEALLDEDGQIENWVAAWGNVVSCLVGLNNFTEAETRLNDESNRLAKAGNDGVVKRVYIEQLLSNLYLQWQISTTADPSKSTAQDLEFFKKAFTHNPNNPNVLRGLTRIAISTDAELAKQARELYDAESHPEPPAEVLNELGSDALAKGNYQNSIKYFEQARIKAPQDSTILNNLAYVYLVGEDRNPERALKLVEEAIRFLPSTEQARKIASHFYDTRGNALMQLNRMTDAAASFEIALRDRPWNRSILEALVKCYQGSNLSAEIYENRLKELDTREAAGEVLNTPLTPQSNN